MASAQILRLQRRLEAIPQRVRDDVQPALLASANELAGRMKQLAPHDSYDMINSIEVTTGGHSTPPYSQPGGSSVVPENAVAITVGNSEVRYAHLVEHGTAHAPAQPFFWIAFRLLQKRIKNRIKRGMSKAVREGWNK